jgi:hypothetical protein
MPDFEDQATRLAELYRERALLGRTIWLAEQGIAERQRALTPAEGWPGKNDEARKAAREAAFAADDAIANHQVNLAGARERQLLLDGEVQAVEAERRAAEWRIRERLVEALVQGGVAHQSRGDRMESAFDDVGQQQVDGAAFEELDF